MGISLALTAFGIRLLAKNGKGTSKSILCIPVLGVDIELAEEDVDDVGLLEDMLGGLQSDDILSVRGIFGLRGRLGRSWFTSEMIYKHQIKSK